jgi:hypothetical protein
MRIVRFLDWKNRKMKMLKMLIIISLLSMNGCGLIVYGTHQDVKIETDPPGLSAVNNGKSCITPCVLDVSRKSTEMIIIRPDGTDLSTELKRSFNWLIIPGNFWNGWLGLLYDGLYGAFWTIEDVNIRFPKTEAREKKSIKKRM